MGRIPDEAINEIRNRVDIVDFVGRYVSLKKAGSNYKGLCPFHDEKTPSFNVNADRQIFHCFGCDAGGDVVGFLMRHDNLSFPEAARTLARENGIDIPETNSAASAEHGISERVFAANECAQRVYHDALRSPEGEGARDYLKRRGLTGEQVQELGIGFAPDRWDAVATALAADQIPADIGEKAGLIAARRTAGGHYDRLRGRVTFPIHDVRGRIVGFGGRAMAADQEPKYLNTPESPVFRKRDAFYGFPNALAPIRKAERAIVCEGYFDRIALYRAGLGEGLATCGTALTREHARQLRRRTQHVVLIFDGDAAGHKATERALEVLLPEGLRVDVASLPDGQDPDDVVEAQGAEALRELVESAPSALDSVIRRATLDGCLTPGAKADAVDRVAPLLALLPNPIEREAHSRSLASRVGASEAAVAAIVRAAGGGKRPGQRPELDDVSPVRRTAAGASLAAELANAFLRDPSLAKPEVCELLAAELPDDGADKGWKELALAFASPEVQALESADGGFDLHGLTALAALLGDPARARLHELAAGAERLAPKVLPDQVVREACQRLRMRRSHRERRASTQRAGSTGIDLAEKQRQLESRRAALPAGAASR